MDALARPLDPPNDTATTLAVLVPRLGYENVEAIVVDSFEQSRALTSAAAEHGAIARDLADVDAALVGRASVT